MSVLEQKGNAPALFDRQTEQGGSDLRPLVRWQVRNKKPRVIHERVDLFLYT